MAATIGTDQHLAALALALALGACGRSEIPVPPPRPPIELPRASIPQLALGSGHSCLLQDGEITCWGYAAYDELGVEGFPTGAVRPDIAGEPVQISASGHDTCALIRDGYVVCWGYNEYHEIAPSLPDERLPTRIDLPGPSVAVSTFRRACNSERHRGRSSALWACRTESLRHSAGCQCGGHPPSGNGAIVRDDGGNPMSPCSHT
jgi:hypothetical protein